MRKMALKNLSNKIKVNKVVNKQILSTKKTNADLK